MPRSRIARLYGNSVSNFLRSFHTVSTVGAPSYTPTRSAQRPPTSSPAFVFWLFDGSHPDDHEVDLTVLFICVSPMISYVEHLFMYFLRKMSVQGRCPFPN